MSKFVFSQLVDLLPHRVFDTIVQKFEGDKWIRTFSCWSHLLVMVFAQLIGCSSLRELICLLTAHRRKTKFLGFGDTPITRSNLSKANNTRDYRIFETFAYHMIGLAQKARINRIFSLHGQFYAFDSTTVNLCLNVFCWATFRDNKGGIKIHTMLDIVTQVPTFLIITEAIVNDVNAMDSIPYERGAFYIFDKGYYDWDRLYYINQLRAFFVIRQKVNMQYEIDDGEDLLSGEDGVLLDQTVHFALAKTINNYPGKLRRVVYYSQELGRTFTYLTNNWELRASDIALLYKNRWQVELFFKWIKQHLRIKRFWGESENAVRIQVYSAIIAYCLVALAEHKFGLDRSMYDVLRVVGHSLLDTMEIKELFREIDADDETTENTTTDGQLSLNFDDV